MMTMPRDREIAQVTDAPSSPPLAVSPGPIVGPGAGGGRPVWSRVMGVVALGALVALAACRSGGGPPPPEEPEAPMVPLAPGAELYYDDSGGVTQEIREVVRDPEGLREMWEQATEPRSEPPPVPDVDFEESMVLVVGAGRMSPGDRIQVDSAGVRTERTTEDEEEIFEVIVRTVEACVDVSGEAFPLHVVRVPRFDGRVSFAERSDEEECGEA